MKKILMLLLVAIIVLMCCACSGEKVKKLPADSNSSSDIVSNVDNGSEDSSSENKELVLKHDADYVLVAKKSREIEISSTDDFVKYSVGYIDETDSMAYALYYDFKETVMYNAANDAQAGLSGDIDTVIISRSAINDDCEIIWDFATK